MSQRESCSLPFFSTARFFCNPYAKRLFITRTDTTRELLLRYCVSHRALNGNFKLALLTRSLRTRTCYSHRKLTLSPCFLSSLSISLSFSSFPAHPYKTQLSFQLAVQPDCHAYYGNGTGCASTRRPLVNLRNNSGKNERTEEASSLSFSLSCDLGRAIMRRLCVREKSITSMNIYWLLDSGRPSRTLIMYGVVFLAVLLRGSLRV